MKGNMSFRLKLSLIVTFILAFALFLNLLLVYFHFEKCYPPLVYSRFGIIAADLEEIINYGSSLGLSLEEFTNIRAALESSLLAHDDILSIVVFNSKGRVLYSTEREGAAGERAAKNSEVSEKAAREKENDDYFPAEGTGESNISSSSRAVPETWVSALDVKNHESKLEWPERNAIVIVRSLVNDYNVVNGGIALAYSSDLVTGPIEKIRRSFVKFFMLLIPACFIVILAGVTLFSKGITGKVKRMSASLESLLAGVVECPVENPAKGESEAGFEKEFCEFREESIRIIETLEADLAAIPPTDGKSPGALK
jgi:hypothetical protein